MSGLRFSASFCQRPARSVTLLPLMPRFRNVQFWSGKMRPAAGGNQIGVILPENMVWIVAVPTPAVGNRVALKQNPRSRREARRQVGNDCCGRRRSADFWARPERLRRGQRAECAAATRAAVTGICSKRNCLGSCPLPPLRVRVYLPYAQKKTARLSAHAGRGIGKAGRSGRFSEGRRLADASRHSSGAFVRAAAARPAPDRSCSKLPLPQAQEPETLPRPTRLLGREIARVGDVVLSIIGIDE